MSSFHEITFCLRGQMSSFHEITFCLRDEMSAFHGITFCGGIKGAHPGEAEVCSRLAAPQKFTIPVAGTGILKKVLYLCAVLYKTII
jgi:hypothetical protein